MKKKIITILIALILITVIIITSIKITNKEEENNDLTAIRLAEVTHSVFYAPMYVAIENGYFEEEGIEIDLILTSGADKVSVNSGALKNPQLIRDAAQKYGSQCVVLSVDIKKVDHQWHVFAKGGREDTGLDALAWIEQGVQLGCGEIVINSMDTDGVKQGFDIPLLKAISDLVDVPIVASGGAGKVADFVELFQLPKIEAGLAASIFHYGEVKIPDLKQALQQAQIPVREV